VTFQPPNPLKRTIIKIKKPQGDNLTGDDLRRFERFWTDYPKKEGKGACRRWWKEHTPDDVLLGRMLTAIQQAAQTSKWQEQAGKFIPMPATWLIQERWDDEYTVGVKTAEVCTERVQNGDARHLKHCGKPIALDQPSPVRPFCAEHLISRQRISARLANGHSS
jgi:hypothetical protein